MSQEPNEDLIQATIQRVAAAKAARESRGAGEPQEPVAETAAAAPPEAEPAPAAAEAAESLAEAPEPDHAAVDEDVIEATIRRVAAARAARETEPAPAPEPPEPAVDPPVAEADTPAPRPVTPLAPEPQPEPAAADGDGRWAADLQTLRREVEELHGMMRELQARVEAAFAAAGAGRPPAPQAADGDEWDDAPAIPRIPLGQPLRPAIFRDPSPHTATAEQLVEAEPDKAVIDTRPIPRPLPPLHAEPKRGLDLLPRTYRLTVEDKRRGVDLVPLHRALLGMDGVRDMSLLSYSNGVAIISVQMVHELAPDVLEQAVARAMSRPAKVEVHNDTTMVVKLAEE